MQVQNAIKKLEKAGFTVTKERISFRAYKGGQSEIRFMPCTSGDMQSGITCIEVRGINAKDDSMTDYFAGTWMDSITQAIKFAN